MKEKIFEILEEICPFETIEEDTLLIEMGILDSLAIVTLIERIEDEFNIEIREEDIVPENFVAINSILQLISSYLDES